MILLLKIRLLLIQQSRKMNTENFIHLKNIKRQERLGKAWKILEQMIQKMLLEVSKHIQLFKDIIQQG